MRRMADQCFIAIDLKSFYASVECVDRKLDPLRTNLVVADESRTEKTICLAVSPALKAAGVPGRPRLFEVVQIVREINTQRQRRAPGHKFEGKSCDASCLANNPAFEFDYIVAVPRMRRYIEASSKIYAVYLKFIAPEHIHVYSIDEVFIDAAPYLKRYKLTGHELAVKLIREVLAETGITATAGVGSNLYLSKVAMDIVAKHMKADKDGVRIAELDEQSYREKLWTYRPLTDFWRIGQGYAARLASMGLYTMGDIARMSVKGEELLYRMFGVNAELLIDHAWGWEPVTMADIKSYKPESRTLSSGQVLKEPYSFEKGLIVVKEMADQLALDLVDKQFVTNQIVLEVGYDTVAALSCPDAREEYPRAAGGRGRAKLKSDRGSENLKRYTSDSGDIIAAAERLFNRIVNKDQNIRRINLAAARLVLEDHLPGKADDIQPDLFTGFEAQSGQKEEEEKKKRKARRLQKTILDIKKRYGKNAVLKGMSLLDGATARERNQQIGGHKE